MNRLGLQSVNMGGGHLYGLIIYFYHAVITG